MGIILLPFTGFWAAKYKLIMVKKSLLKIKNVLKFIVSIKKMMSLTFFHRTIMKLQKITACKTMTLQSGKSFMNLYNSFMKSKEKWAVLRLFRALNWILIKGCTIISVRLRIKNFLKNQILKKMKISYLLKNKRSKNLKKWKEDTHW